MNKKKILIIVLGIIGYTMIIAAISIGIYKAQVNKKAEQVMKNIMDQTRNSRNEENNNENRSINEILDNSTSEKLKNVISTKPWNITN